ncbi:uncharacterized protein OCT59_006927 [Rhizophagus irregularis]|uniref:uncharacterized protein n=1 Tax=Rhizophagus irregularis TaxID=588596 RepID=UPI00331BD716|nr:hypothetical protein OCT59_006927 [Rhizophagus irregularis]
MPDNGTLKNYLDWNIIKLQFAIQIADAISCIHRRDIIHHLFYAVRNDLSITVILFNQHSDNKIGSSEYD